MIKMLYLYILQADSTENWNAFCKLIVLDNYKISKQSKKSVLRYIKNITGSVGNFVKCIHGMVTCIRAVRKPVRCFRLFQHNHAVQPQRMARGLKCTCT